MERLAPLLAQRFCLSRRQAEKAITQGRVTLDGEPMKHWFLEGNIEKIRIDGQIVPPLPLARLWTYYKPIGQLVTRYDPQGRPTVFETLRKHLPEGPLVCVGRLDFLSEGLLLVTNKPLMAHFLETSSWQRFYDIWVEGKISSSMLYTLSQGVYLKGIFYRPFKVKIMQKDGPFTQLRIGLREGKKREIRILMTSIGLTIHTLLRISFGPFHLSSFLPGNIKEIPSSQWPYDMQDFFEEMSQKMTKEKVLYEQ